MGWDNENKNKNVTASSMQMVQPTTLLNTAMGASNLVVPSVQPDVLHILHTTGQTTRELLLGPTCRNNTDTLRKRYIELIFIQAV